MKIVIPDHIHLGPEDEQKIKELDADVVIYDDTNNDPKEIIKRIEDAEVITANYIDITKEIIEASPNLKYIIVPAVGYDWVDIDTCNKNGIKVLNTPTHNANAVAEHAIALMFAVSKKIIESHMSILNGAWKPTEIVGSELSGKNLYVIGNGNIGKKIQGLGAALNMNVSYADSKTSESEIDEQLMQADFICLALPLNNQTEGMIHAKRLEIMKDTAILINVARGLIIDQDDLYTALKEGTIAGAGLDVFPDDSTITEPGEGILRFAQLKNVVTTPHNAYNSQETMSRLGSELLADLESCIQSKPINVVN